MFSKQLNGKSKLAVVDTSNSSNALLRPIPISAVRMGDGFWKKRMETNAHAGSGNNRAMLFIEKDLTGAESPCLMFFDTNNTNRLLMGAVASHQKNH